MGVAKTNIEAFKKVGEKYDFPVMVSKNCITMKANNTDGRLVNWIEYNPVSDTVKIVGNTDNMNIWLYATRPDMNPDKCVSFVKELSEALACTFEIKELIDPEDWQELANIQDAYEDPRYQCGRQNQSLDLNQESMELD